MKKLLVLCLVAKFAERVDRKRKILQKIYDRMALEDKMARRIQGHWLKTARMKSLTRQERANKNRRKEPEATFQLLRRRDP